jgi:orotidine-5'-phosphate decarboxylase
VIAPQVGGIFLDLKFCDIPNTVAAAVASAARLPKVRMLTLHTTGGAKMMAAAREALQGVKNPPKLLGVTILTSLGETDIRRIGLKGPTRDRVKKLALLAKSSGLDGIVASAHEIQMVRKAVGRNMLLVVPGVRPNSNSRNAGETQDQARVATPGEAIRWGADYIVVGRPITAAPVPATAARVILREMEKARRKPD